MPELPEVETISRQLKQEVLGSSIKDISILDARVIKYRPIKKFVAELLNRKIINIFRKGKGLIIDLKEKHLIFHLRISAWVSINPIEEKVKFSRVEFLLTDKKICFCDSRVLGHILLVDNWEDIDFFKNLGPEPLEIKFEQFKKIVEGKKTNIKVLLMDQRNIAGIGNIYAQESLFCAGISPLRSSATLKPNEIKKLFYCIKKILNMAIKNQGSSVSTYRQINGASGSQHLYHNVYQRDKQKCFNCGKLIVKRTIAGRGTWFCPNCQK